MKWNLTQIKYKIGSGFIFMLNFSVMESVPISLIALLQTIRKIRFSKDLQNALGQVGRLLGLSLTGRSSVDVVNGIFVVQLSPLLLATSIDFRTQCFKYQYHSNSYTKRCGWNHDVVNPKVVLMTQISSNH